MLNKIKEEENDIDPEKLVCTKSDGKIFNFNTFKSSLKFASSIYNGKITLEEAKEDQYEMFKQLKDLKKYDHKIHTKKKSRKEILTNADKLYNNRNNVINAFENKDFPFKYESYQKEELDVVDKALPDWVKVDKKRFDRIKNKIQNAKNNFVVPGGSGVCINADNSY